MAKNWLAYEAAEVLLKGTDLESVAEIGSRFPLLTVAVMRDGTEVLCDILKAVPKVTARVVETGLKDFGNVESEAEEQKDKAPEKASKDKKTTKVEEPEESEDDYESMTSKALYKLCCDRGISSQCKKRDKASLIAVLKANEGKSEEDDWDEEDEEEETDAYAGKTAKELYKMCCDRGIKAKTKQSAEAYVKLLKKADEAEAESEEDEDDDDWEI